MSEKYLRKFSVLEHKKIIGSRPFVHRDICPDDVFELSVTSKSKNALSLDIMLY